MGVFVPLGAAVVGRPFSSAVARFYFTRTHALRCTGDISCFLISVNGHFGSIGRVAPPLISDYFPNHYVGDAVPPSKLGVRDPARASDLLDLFVC